MHWKKEQEFVYMCLQVIKMVNQQSYEFVCNEDNLVSHS